MNRRKLLKSLVSVPAAVVAGTGMALAVHPEMTLAQLDKAIDAVDPPTHFFVQQKQLPTRVSTDEGDPAYDLCWAVRRVKNIYLDGKVHNEAVITADSTRGYLLCLAGTAPGDSVQEYVGGGHPADDLLVIRRGKVHIEFSKNDFNEDGEDA